MPSGESRPVAPPRMVAIGSVSPVASGAKIEIVLSQAFATYVLPLGSIAMPTPVSARPITASGATSPFAPGAYVSTELLEWSTTKILAVGGNDASDGARRRLEQPADTNAGNDSAAIHFLRREPPTQHQSSRMGTRVTTRRRDAERAARGEWRIIRREEHHRRHFGASQAGSRSELRFDDDRRAEVDAIVDPDDVGVSHADASPADGSTKKLRLWRAMNPDSPSVAVRAR